MEFSELILWAESYSLSYRETLFDYEALTKMIATDKSKLHPSADNINYWIPEKSGKLGNGCQGKVMFTT